MLKTFWAVAAVALGLLSCSLSVNAAPSRIPKDVLSLESKCQGGDVDSCLKVGTIFLKGDKVKVNLERAAKWYTKGCELGSGVSCEQAIGAYTKKGDKADGHKILALIKQACDLDMQGSCTFIKDNQQFFQ